MRSEAHLAEVVHIRGCVASAWLTCSYRVYIFKEQKVMRLLVHESFNCRNFRIISKENLLLLKPFLLDLSANRNKDRSHSELLSGARCRSLRLWQERQRRIIIIVRNKLPVRHRS